MATIYPNRKDGKIVSFKFKAFLGRNEHGKQIFKCKTWIPDKRTTEKKLLELAEKESIIWERQAAAKYEEEKQALKPNRILFNDFIDVVWYPSLTGEKENRHTTLTFYNSLLRVIKPYFERKLLSGISSNYIESFLNYLKNDYKTQYNKPLSQQSIKHYYSALKYIFDYAVKLDYIPKNPVQKLAVPKLAKRKVNALTRAETQVFMQEIDKLPIMQKTMYSLLLTTGIRRGECFGLQWQDVDFVGGLIRIERNVTYTKLKGIVIGKPKTETGVREIPLTDNVLRLLEEYKSNKWAAANAFVFHAEKSPFAPHNPDYVTKHLKRFMKRINLPDMSPHDLRHTCGSLLIQSGADIKSVQDILGHADASTTLNFYVKSDMNNMRKATANAFNW